MKIGFITKQFRTTIELDVTVYADIGTSISTTMESPAEPAEVIHMSILGRNHVLNGSTDLTHLLSEKDYEAMKEQALTYEPHLDP
tara:strand:- start:116 stop:370 length:255 start_codon:yes stop_codon:yes gene_type:complete